MYFILDNLAATLCGIAVFLLIALTQSMGQRTAMDSVEFSASRATTGAFLLVLEQDFANVGAAVEAGTIPIHALRQGEDEDAPTAYFEFSGATDPVEEAPVVRVRYETRPATTVEVPTPGGGTRTAPAYTVVRLVDYGDGFQESTRTAGYVTEFAIDLLDGAGAPVGDRYADARVITLRLAATTLSGRGGTLTGARVQRSFPLQHLVGA